MDADVVIIGAGPAGIQAAIHAARKKVSVVLIGKTQNSAMMGTHIENYFGMPGEVNGELILKNGMSQVKIFGRTVLEKNLVSASNVGSTFTLTTEDDHAGDVIGDTTEAVNARGTDVTIHAAGSAGTDGNRCCAGL